MKRIAMKAILAVLAGVFGVGTAAAQESGGSSKFDQILAEIIGLASEYLPAEVNQALLEVLMSLGIV